MALPFDNAFTLLTSASAALRTDYMDGFFDQSYFFGGSINKILALSKRQHDGKQFVIQCKTGKAYNANASKDIYSNFPTPRGFLADSYTATLDETASTNDFCRVASRISTGYLDIQRRLNTQTAAVDVAEELVKDMNKDFAEKMAFLRQCDKTCKVATVSADTPKQDDNPLFASATATPAASTGARFKVLTTGPASFAFFQKGKRFDVYDGTTGAFKSTLEVTSATPQDFSVGAINVNTTTNARDTVTAVGTAKINANDVLYMNGDKDEGPNSFGEWFKLPTSGDSFYTRDRTNFDYRWMRPTRAGPTSSQPFTKSYLDDLYIATQYKTPEPDSEFVVLMQPEIEQSFRNEVGEQIIIQYPTASQQGKLQAQYGFDGQSIYRSPIGRMILTPEALAAPGNIRFYKLGSWEQLNGIKSGEKITMIERGEMGFWYSLNESGSGTGRSLVYAADGFALFTDICTDPQSNYEIGNLTA